MFTPSIPGDTTTERRTGHKVAFRLEFEQRVPAPDVQSSAAIVDAPTRAPQIFPAEILLTILTHLIAGGQIHRNVLLRSLKEISLVSTLFLKPCQQELFRLITLHPPPPPMSAWESPRHPFRNFIEAVVNNPALGIYVHRLEYMLPYLPPSLWHGPQLDGFSQALSYMVNLEELLLEGILASKVLVHDSADDGSRDHTSAILSLMNSPKLRTLTVINTKIPRHLFAPSPALETLRLISSPLKYPSTWDSDPALAAVPHPTPNFPGAGAQACGKFPPVISTRHLVLRGLETSLWLQRLVYDSMQNPTNNFYNNLPFSLLTTETLEIELRTASFGTSFIHCLLPHAPRLKQLHLVAASELQPSWVFPEDPLAGLHPGSFATLTVLSFEIGVTVAPSQNIPNPYRGLFHSNLGRPAVITHLTRLEEVTINITLSGPEWGNHPDAAFGAQWGDMDKTLASPAGGWTPFGCLERVTLYVLLGADHDSASEFIGKFEERVLDAQFEGLRRLEAEGAVSLILDVDNWDSGDDLPDTPLVIF